MAKVKKSYLDLINDCDSFPYELSAESIYRFYLPQDPRPHGYIRASTVQTMPWTSDFHINHLHKTVSLTTDPSESNAALARLIDLAIAQDTFRIIHRQHSEPYSIIGSGYNGTPPVSLERYFAPLFGITSRGAHLTIYTRPAGHSHSSSSSPRDLKIWVPRRSEQCFTFPGCLDTTVAGGLPSGETPFSCVVREAEEEASVSPPFVRAHARAAGMISYVTQSGAGDGGELGLISPDMVYVFDLEVDESFVCRPHDDEVKEFRLMSVDEVEAALGRAEFKTNSAVVMIDFFVRHGVITPENEVHYAQILMHMHRRLPFPTTVDDMIGG